MRLERQSVVLATTAKETQNINVINIHVSGSICGGVYFSFFLSLAPILF